MFVLLAALSAVAYGVSDLTGGLAVQRSARPGASLTFSSVVTAVGAVYTGVWLLAVPPEAVTRTDLGWSLLAGLIMAVARPVLFQGMAVGPIAVFAPVYGLTGITLPALAGPFIDQHLGNWEMFGVLMAVPAVVLLSSQRQPARPGLMMHGPVLARAVFVGACIGGSGVCFSFVDEAAGVFPVFTTMIIGSLVVTTAAGVTGVGRPTLRLAASGALVAISLTLAFALVTAAYQRGSAAVVPAVVCLGPGVSMVLAWRFLGERISRLQMVGGVFAVSAVAAFALGI